MAAAGGDEYRCEQPSVDAAACDKQPAPFCIIFFARLFAALAVATDIGLGLGYARCRAVKPPEAPRRRDISVGGFLRERGSLFIPFRRVLLGGFVFRNATAGPSQKAQR